MACCMSSSHGQKEKNNQINADLRNGKQEMSKTINLLLLGTGDSGKSTFAKQMKLIHAGGFTKTETEKYKHVLRDATLKNMKKLVHGLKQNHTCPSGMKKHFARIMDSTEPGEDVLKAIQHVWKNKKAKDFFKNKRAELSISCQADYYFEQAERYFADDFEPTEEDILRAKQKTTGVVETIFNVQGVKLKLIDVGGQRTERRKWLHCFEDVTAVIYVASLEEYDAVLEEDPTQNRMEEALSLFSEVSGSPFFRDAGFMLFLNKKDLFQQKIEEDSAGLKKLFADYDGGEDYDKASNFIQEKYQDKFNGHVLYPPYTTTAVDRNNIKVVMSTVLDILIRAAVENTTAV